MKKTNKIANTLTGNVARVHDGTFIVWALISHYEISQLHKVVYFSYRMVGTKN